MILTIYLGIYNGERYIESLFGQIRSQTNQNFEILVVDNNSTDSSGNMLETWKKYYKKNFRYVRNNLNYGGAGSLYRNLHKIKTPWFCTLHQDDFYKPNHISSLIDLILCSNKNIVGVSTTMGSMSNEGTILNSKPRTSWFSKELDAPGQFLQNLRAQSVPFPASAFRLEIFKKTQVPFHNPTFSDTEQTLNMLAYGRFAVSQEETMFYRENSTSESHSLNPKEIIIGAGVSLTRVLNSTNFKIILERVEKNKRELFARELVKSLELRLPQSELLTTLQINVLEVMLKEWGYEHKKIAEILMGKYQKFASKQTIEVISKISQNKNKKIINNHQNTRNKTTKVHNIWERYFQLNLGHFGKFNKPFITLIYKIVFFIKPNHRMKTKW
jgi:glycosyltransferase involved in cell wall biosynthesis